MLLQLFGQPKEQCLSTLHHGGKMAGKPVAGTYANRHSGVLLAHFQIG